MASKRSAEVFTDSDSSEETPARPSTKRAKHDAGSKKRQHQSAYMDATWGQKYFFLGQDRTTSIPQDDELDFEDDTDAMDYLRSVRDQATGIPHLLVAPKIGPQLPPSSHGQDEAEEGEVDHDIYEDGTGDFRGYYHDGAYTAVPDEDFTGEFEDEEDYSQGEINEGEGQEEDQSAVIAEAYFSSLRNSFATLRETLHATPPPEITHALPRTHSPFVGPLGTKSPTFKIWSKRLRTTDPIPAQVAAMDRDGVLRVLRVIMGGKFLRVGKELRERTSRWLWALLARLPDRGEMSHADIAWIRDLGKRAVLMSRSLAEMAALRDELENGGGDLGVNEAFDDSDDDEEVVRETAVDESDEENHKSSQSDARAAQTRDERAPQDGEEPAPKKLNHEEEPEKEPAPPAEHELSELEEGEQPEDGRAQREANLEEGEEADDVPMDLDEDGDFSDTEDLETAKARLLARLNQGPDDSSQVAEDAGNDSAALRARMNMRATLNMILTVAGEFYGQLDLLEFRDPFTGI